jgi:hypothetical protein
VVYEGLHQVPVSAVLRGGHGVHSGGKQLFLFSITKKGITNLNSPPLGTVSHFITIITIITIYGAVLRGGHGVHSGGKQLIIFSSKTTKEITNLNSPPLEP